MQQMLHKYTQLTQLLQKNCLLSHSYHMNINRAKCFVHFQLLQSKLQAHT